ncbi:substrate-binding periplasmic protein [Rhodoferax sp.]|uniref:substrate-binding periplasmic protein n=1 Tax=Rhodoferax sp. TaxID=50421 RepID=UPI002ACDE602|nr:transporter substrate-binding domain-containing protein [Rhodoferax sp.]MDZ7920120.1 transporter substrate-binding domain-containing protein [Rhodoferax sp.]
MFLFNGVVLVVALLAGGPWAFAQSQPPVLQALTESLPPLNYENDGKITGFASELLDLMAAEAGITLQKQLLPWVRAYDRATKPGDTVLYSLVRTPERESLFRWVGPIGSRRISLYKWSDRQDIQLKSLEDARAYRIGTTLESAATKNLIKQGFVPMPLDGAASGLELGVNDEQNMRKFIAKRFDLLVSLDWAAAYNAKNAGMDPAQLVPALVLDESLSYWYGLNLAVDPEVAKRLNAALQKVRNDGRYTQLRQKYLLKASK